MTWARALLLIATLSLAAAGIVGLVSRAPAEVRERRAAEDATDPGLGASFTDEQIARHGAYRRPGYVSFVAGLVLQVVTLVVLARGPWARLVESLESRVGAWPLRALLAGAVVALILTTVTLPLAFVRGFVVEHAWGLSTQAAAGWASDQLKGAAVGAVTSAVAAVVFFAVLRWQPGTWWVWGWGAFTGLTAVMFFLWPVVVAPLFNDFTPLERGPLDQRVRALADEAGVPVDEVLVADASRRTTAENAYVAGLGGTKRLVLYDTLLAAGSEDQTAFVVAHELGHQAEGHVVKNLLISTAGLLAGFALLGWLGTRRGLWEWAGAAGPGDLRALPLLVLLVTALTLVSTPLQAALSRRFEADADAIAIRLTEDPDAAVSAFRRLALNNLADLDPPPVAVALFYSHPPIPDRIRAALATAGERP
ncbi:MAG TPA: M48 family metallopeptidase [Actinomycetota bacterium]|nr:M48 family metallopeptidase [Actinomycetota bacterium]